MLKRYLLILLTSIIYANPSVGSTSIVPLDEPFNIESNSSIFNTDVLYTHKELLECTPKLDAVYKIKGIHKLKIIPKKQLKSGTTYKCHYEKSSIDFTTKPFAISEYYYFNQDKLLRIRFNDAIDPEKVKNYIHILKKDKLTTTKLTYSIKQQNSNTLILKINEPIDNKVIELTIDKELTNQNHISLDKSFSATFNEKKVSKVKLDKKKEAMVIVDKPQMVSLDNGRFAIRIFLEDTLSNEPKDFIKVDGIENFSVYKNNYINYKERKRLKLSSSAYYYTDIMSSEFKPNHTYKITIKKGLRDYRELKKDEHFTVKSGDLSKSIIFDDKKTYISNSGELGFSSINIDSVTLVLERVLDDNLRYFINFENGDKAVIDNYVEEVLTKEIKLHNIKNKIVKQKFSFSSLSTQLPFGIYRVTLRFTDKKEEKNNSKVIFLSNIGISANISKTQAFIHTMSLDTAEPLVTAMVYLYGANNELIGSAKSDKYGMVNIQDDKLLSKKPKGIVVQTKQDTNFLALNESISSPTPEDILKTPKKFSANIYLQSKIVRPSSKINALIIVKNRDFISANELPIKVILKEKYGKVIEKKIYHTDNYGLINFHYQLDNEDKTGTYDIEALIGDTIIGSASVKVEAFMPPKIENHIKLSKNRYYTGEVIEANISSNYLFGTPASKLNGKVTVDTRAMDLTLSKYKGYSFSNKNIEKENTQIYLDYSEDIKLDAQGKLNIYIPTKVKMPVPSILKATIGVTIMDDTQPVSIYKAIKLFPYKNMVGLKIESNHFEKGKNLTGKAILVNPLTGKELKQELYVVIKKMEWHYSYSNGNSNWEEESKIVDRFKIESNTTFSRKLNKNGEYVIEVYDRLGGHSASSEFDIWWQDYTNISPKDDLKSIEIDFEDKYYKKDDTIMVTIKSPIVEGELLLTIEDEKVEGYKLLKIKNGTAKVEMPITFDMHKGAYLHAMVYRATNTSSQLIPFRAIGYKYIEPNNDIHKIDIKIESPKESKSKRLMHINVVTNKASKILISVVDKGILQLVGQQEPNIFDFFNKQADNKISYYDMYDEIMAYLTDGKLIDFGAGDSTNGKKHLVPDLSKRVKPFMIWSGIIEPKDNNTAIGIDIPEFNGKASIVAIAINNDSIGVTSKDIIIKDDIMIKPSYPLYTLQGDKLDIPIRVFNTTTKSKKLVLSRVISKNIEFDFEDKNLTLAPNSSVLIQAKLYAKDIGEATIQIIANDGNDTVTNSVELNIYNPYSISTKTFKGISNEKESFTIPKEYEGAKVYITMSNNLIGALGNDLKYLVGYPYGCAEQTTSKILAMHYAKAFLKDTVLIGESTNFIRQGIKKLINMQNYYGEFSYWESDGEINSYASLYASQTLLELKRDGVDIEDTIINRIIKMLESVLTKNDNYLGSYTNFHRVYAGYILAQHNKLTQSNVNMLYEKGFYHEHFLSKYYMSAILKMQGRDAEADKLYDSVGYNLSDYKNSKYSNDTGNFESNIRDLLLQFIIKTQYFKKDVKDLSIVENSFDELYSTQERAIALKAISIYLGKPVNSKMDITLDINGESKRYIKPTSLIFDSITTDKIVLTPNSNAMSYTIELVKHLPKKLKNKLDKSKTISIQREFIDEKKSNLDLNKLIQGNKIYSKVTITNLGKINSVVVNQRIPACLKIVNDRIQDEILDQRFVNIDINQEYKDIRDDRVLNFIDLPKEQIYDKKKKKNILKIHKGVIFTPLIVTAKGECKVPAVIIESMYDSRISDYAKGVDVIRVINANKKTKK